MDVSVTIDFLEKLPFEEWQSAIESLIEENPVNIIKVPQKEADLARLTLDKMLEVS